MKVTIFQIVIDSETWESKVCSDDYVSSVLSRCAEWGRRGDNYVSSPLVSWSYATNEIRHALRESDLDGYRIRYETLDITEDYEIYATTADKAYDYAYVIQLATLDPLPIGRKQTERLVAIPKERAAYQVARYGSGLNATRPVV